MDKKYIGIDWGEKRIGTSLAEESLKLATPFKVVSDINELLDLIEEEEIDTIVLGKPIKMSGQKEQLTASYERFVEELKKKTNLEIYFVDERLSSKGADALFGNKKNKAQRDALAAMLILQSYLDSLL